MNKPVEEGLAQALQQTPQQGVGSQGLGDGPGVGLLGRLGHQGSVAMQIMITNDGMGRTRNWSLSRSPIAPTSATASMRANG